MTLHGSAAPLSTMPKGVEHEECSTPFGIIGILTALGPTPLFAATCQSVFAHPLVSLSHPFPLTLTRPSFRATIAQESDT